jgi:hypothetical protein
MEDLPFYRGSAVQRKDIMSQAIAWGYKNNIIIKTSYSDNIEFFRGEALEETDLNKLIISWSTEMAENYTNEYAPWDSLHQLTNAQGLHFTSHHLLDK